jgi:hypothetical protein
MAVAGDTTVGINDTISLYAEARDPIGTALRYYWKWGFGSWHRVHDGDTMCLAPAVPRSLQCSLRVVDDDANTVYAAMTADVQRRSPIARAGRDTSVSIDDSLCLDGRASTDESRIIQYFWKCGDGVWLLDGDGVLRVQAPSNAQTWTCSLRVIDDDGNTACDAKTIQIHTGLPIADAGTDTTVGINDTVLLHGSGSDETRILSLAWKLDGAWHQVSNGDTAVAAPAITQTWTCSLRVIDDDGITAFDAKTIRTASVHAGNDTSICFGGYASPAARVSPTFGTVATCEWTIGAGGWNRSSLDTVFQVPPSAQTYACVVRVTNPDGFTLCDTLLLTVTRLFSTTHTITGGLAHPNDLAAADLDGDSDIDVVCGSGEWAEGAVTWFENNGAGSFSMHTIDACNDITSVYLFDADNDTDQDVLCTSSRHDRVAFFENGGTGTFAAAHVIVDEHDFDHACENARDALAADIDGDGDKEVIAASSQDAIYHYDRITTYFPTIDTVSISCNYPVALHANDLTGNGFTDIISVSAYGYSLEWHENDGTGAFTTHPVASLYPTAVFSIDCDNDGDVDIVTADNIDDKIAWFENNGTGGFTAHTVTSSCDRASDVYAADCDGDGDTDILSASFGANTIAWYENRGDGHWVRHAVSTVVNDASAVLTADCDGDGDLDVLAASQADNTLYWFENASRP